MKSLPCLARNGRHLIIGFSSGIEAEEVPMVNGRTLCFGNISLLGVILSYRDPAVVSPGSGFNPTRPPRWPVRSTTGWENFSTRGKSTRSWPDGAVRAAARRPRRHGNLVHRGPGRRETIHQR